MANLAVNVINPTDILTPEQLAERLQVRRSWVFEKTRARRSAGPPLPFMRVGKHLRFSWPAIEKWLAEDCAAVAPTRVRRYRRRKKVRVQ